MITPLRKKNGTKHQGSVATVIIPRNIIQLSSLYVAESKHYSH